MIGLQQPDAPPTADAARVDARHGERVGRDVDRIDPCTRESARTGDRDAAGAGARYRRMRRTRARIDPGLEAPLDQLGDRRARNQHPLVDVHAAGRRTSSAASGRRPECARACAARAGLEAGALRLAHAGLQTAAASGARPAQRVQHQRSGLIARVVGAMAKCSRARCSVRVADRAARRPRSASPDRPSGRARQRRCARPAGPASPQRYAIIAACSAAFLARRSLGCGHATEPPRAWALCRRALTRGPTVRHAAVPAAAPSTLPRHLCVHPLAAALAEERADPRLRPPLPPATVGRGRARADGLPSFNAFFTRALKPGARPMPTAAARLVSPCDGTVGQAGTLADDELLQAKGHGYRPRSCWRRRRPRRPLRDGTS